MDDNSDTDFEDTLRCRVRNINSRARRASAPGQITVAGLAEELADAKNRCSRCGKPFGSRYRDCWVVCFVVPFSQGGECARANITITCRGCEMKRAKKMGIHWPE